MRSRLVLAPPHLADKCPKCRVTRVTNTAERKTITKSGHAGRVNDVRRRCDTDSANDALVAVVRPVRLAMRAEVIGPQPAARDADGVEPSKRVDVAGGPVSFPDRARRRRLFGLLIPADCDRSAHVAYQLCCWGAGMGVPVSTQTLPEFVARLSRLLNRIGHWNDECRPNRCWSPPDLEGCAHGRRS